MFKYIKIYHFYSRETKNKKRARRGLFLQKIGEVKNGKNKLLGFQNEHHQDTTIDHQRGTLERLLGP